LTLPNSAQLTTLEFVTINIPVQRHAHVRQSSPTYDPSNTNAQRSHESSPQMISQSRKTSIVPLILRKSSPSVPIPATTPTHYKHLQFYPERKCELGMGKTYTQFYRQWSEVQKLSMLSIFFLQTEQKSFLFILAT
jgi:hypothetical protein